MSWHKDGSHCDPRETVLRTTTHTEAAETGRWHSQQGDYRAAAVWHQLAAALAATDRIELPPRWTDVVKDNGSWMPDQKRALVCDACGMGPYVTLTAYRAHVDSHGACTHTGRTRVTENGVPVGPWICTGCGAAQMHPSQMPGQGPTGDGDKDLTDTASIPLPESHAPTTCVYLVAVEQADQREHRRLCGELIRWNEPNGWHHVNDRHLGESSHPATPQGTPGPLPQRHTE